jgi:hypothetical protein
MTWAEIELVLGNTEQLTEPVQRFAGDQLPANLPPEMLPNALKWLSRDLRHPQSSYHWEELTDKLIELGALHANDPSVRSALVDLLVRRVTEHFLLRGGNSRRRKPGWGPQAHRYLIAADLAPQLRVRNRFLLLRADPAPLLTSADLPFVLERWQQSEAADWAIWEELTIRLTAWDDPRQYDLVVHSVGPPARVKDVETPSMRVY